MLKKRLITAAILVPLVLCAMLYANYWVLLGLLVFTLALGANEWASLVPVSDFRKRLLFLVAVVAGAFVAGIAFEAWVAIGLVLWGLIIFAIITYPASQKFWGNAIFVMAAGVILLPLAGYSAIGLYQLAHGAGLLIYVLALVAVSDSGAYFVGKKFGRHALISKVSAGKTIEGAMGGLLLPMGVAAIGAYVFSPNHLFSWFVLALLTVVISMFGDLSISMLKRRCHLKDTGTLLPGHGGVLDRLDSMIAALPWFLAGLRFFCLDINHV